MAVKTKLLVVSTTPVAVRAYVRCRQIAVREDGSISGQPRAFRVRAPESTDDPVQHYEGETMIFEETRRTGGFYQPNDIAGYIEVLTGSTTFQVVCRGGPSEPS